LGESKPYIANNCYVKSVQQNLTLEKTEGTIRNEQSIDIGNIGLKTQNEDKQNKV